ncbi:hypothetical protein [Kineococcus sp. SYSU DK002]|uniref:hypothetical protein n=1 Tax=Kineococcus sp. SYSU DK002 TaxID=3383123 RepID=UPI003D7E8ECF
MERDLDVTDDEGAPGGRRYFSQWALQEIGAHDEPTEQVVSRLWQRLQPAESSFTALRLAGCPLHFAITQDVTIADGEGRTSFVLPSPFVRFLGDLGAVVEFDQHVA